MKRFKVKPYTEPRKPQTPAQEAAAQRSFRIFRLRGLWELAAILSPSNREIVQGAIDAELQSLGAVPHSQRHAENLAAFAAELTARRAEDFAEVELPF